MNLNTFMEENATIINKLHEEIQGLNTLIFEDNTVIFEDSPIFNITVDTYDLKNTAHDFNVVEFLISSSEKRNELLIKVERIKGE